MQIDQIFQDPFAFVLAVGSLVAFFRKHIYNIDGKLVIGLSVVIGVGLGFLGNLMGYYPTPDWAIYGVLGGLITSGFVDFIRGAFKMLGNFFPEDIRKKIESFLEAYEKAEHQEEPVATESATAVEGIATPQATAVENADKGKTKLM